MALVNLTWGLELNLTADAGRPALSIITNRVPYLLVLLIWVYFWVNELRRGVVRHARYTGAISGIVTSAGLFVVFIAYHASVLRLQAPELAQDVFVYLYVWLGLVGLALCMAALAVSNFVVPAITVSFALLIAADLYFNARELSNEGSPNSLAEIAWTLSQLLLIVGTASFFERIAEASATNKNSGLLLVNMIPPLTTLICSTVVATTAYANDMSGLALLLVLLALSALLARFLSRALRAAATGAFAAFRTRSERQSPRASPLLEAIGIRDLSIQHLDFLGDSCARVSTAPLFSASETWAKADKKTAFICMPYEEAWSTDVLDALEVGAREAGWHTVRADHSRQDPDALKEIWRLICRSTVIVVDISTYSPNVLYELGLAHALGKPALIVRQDQTRMPFDLSTRRSFKYSLSSVEKDIFEILTTALQDFESTEEE